ncbi:ATP-dependent DNA helicase chl1, partial [Desmophyllum pertusum]
STDPGTLKSPSWAKIPNSAETAVEGRNKTLYCLAIGRPAPKIIWKKNGIPIESGKNSFEILLPIKKGALTSLVLGKMRMRISYTLARPKILKILGILIRTKVIINNNQLEFKNVELAQDGVCISVWQRAKLGMIVSSTWVEVLAKAPTFPSFGPFYLFKESKGRLKCQPDAGTRSQKLYGPRTILKSRIPALGTPSPHYEGGTRWNTGNQQGDLWKMRVAIHVRRRISWVQPKHQLLHTFLVRTQVSTINRVIFANVICVMPGF